MLGIKYISKVGGIQDIRQEMFIVSLACRVRRAVKNLNMKSSIFFDKL